MSVQPNLKGFYLVECEEGSLLKKEVKKEDLYLDRMSTLPFPASYGQISNSPIQEDGDPADFFVVSTTKIPEGTRIEPHKVNIMAKIHYLDKNLKDDKYVICLKSEESKVVNFQRFAFYKILQIRAFLETYKYEEQNIVTRIEFKKSLFSDHPFFTNPHLKDPKLELVQELK